MNANEMFPSKYLKASDLGDHQPVVVIESIEIETIGQGEEAEKKPVISFRGKDKKLVTNKTNWATLISLLGAETNDWPGESIKLLAMEVAFKGKMSMAIRISPQKPASGAAPKAAPKPADDMSDEEIAF